MTPVKLYVAVDPDLTLSCQSCYACAPEPEAMVHDEDCMVAEIERLREHLIRLGYSNIADTNGAKEV